VVVTATPTDAVIWHDLECGGYRADLPLWRELAAAASTGGARVLDLGAGSGRVAVELARAGHQVTALDRDERLLAALSERAGGLPVETVAADAREFSLARGDYDLCLVPMQTLQLLRGAEQRRSLFAAARAHLRDGALLACAIVDQVDDFDSLDGGLGPPPERASIGSTLYLSRAIRVHRGERFIGIERERLALPDGDGPRPPAERDVVELEIVTAAELWAEMRAAGLEPEQSRTIAETEEHSGSEVVIGRA
jgi:SAM-dependent methyltransferase